MGPRGRWTGPQGQPGAGGGGMPRQGGPGGYNYVMPPGQRRGGRQGRGGGQAGRGPPPGAAMAAVTAAAGAAGVGGAVPPAGASPTALPPGPVPTAVPGDPSARGFKWTPDARNKEAVGTAPPPTAAVVADGVALGGADHSAPSQEDRKLQLGEQLFPLIYAVQPKEAGKITGMLLESMNVLELLELAENSVTLNQCITEAMAVLQQAAAGSAATAPPTSTQ